jgi:hypothetical protein
MTTLLLISGVMIVGGGLYWFGIHRSEKAAIWPKVIAVSVLVGMLFLLVWILFMALVVGPYMRRM